MSDPRCFYTILRAPHERLEPLLLDDVAPVVAAIREAPELDSLFFVRYSEPTWQLRFRVLGEPAWIEAEIAPRLRAHAIDLRDRGVIEGCEFATYDRDTSSWRTSQLSLTTPTPSERSSVTWPRSGSMRSGRSYPLAPWVPHTCGTGCSWWPTPRAAMANNLCTYRPQWRRDAPALEQRVAMRGQTGGYLNPTWVEWLMGFPSDWLPPISTP